MRMFSSTILFIEYATTRILDLKEKISFFSNPKPKTFGLFWNVIMFFHLLYFSIYLIPIFILFIHFISMNWIKFHEIMFYVILILHNYIYKFPCSLVFELLHTVSPPHSFIRNSKLFEEKDSVIFVCTNARIKFATPLKFLINNRRGFWNILYRFLLISTTSE